MKDVLDQMWAKVGGYVPHIFGAIAILVIGWLVALAVSAGVRAALKRTSLDEKLGRWLSGEDPPRAIDTAQAVSRGVFYFLMLFVFVACFQALGLTLITDPIRSLLDEVFVYLPKVFAAGGLLLVAWVLASVLRFVIRRGLTVARLDERLGEKTSGEGEAQSLPVSKSLSDVAYWLVFLLFLPAILGALGLAGLLEPVQNLTDQLLGFLPKLLGAAVILAVGWFIARVVQRIVAGLLSAMGADQFSKRVGFDSVLGGQTLSGLLALVAYTLVLIPVLIASLNALALDAITEPASAMLNTILGAIPAIFAAAVILGIALMLGRVVSSLVSNLLAGVGFNRILARLGFGEMKEGRKTPSELVGLIIVIAIMLFATTEAASMLGFESLSNLIARFTVFGGEILLGLIILALGLYLANLASNVVAASSARHAGVLAMTARVAILILASAMALRQIGLAGDIINLAFGLLLGAVAVAAALAFGLGGRTAAQDVLDKWRGRTGT